MADHRVHEVHEATLELISPLHVGSGSSPLVENYDFAVENGLVWVMDHRKLLDLYDEEELRHGIPDVRLSARLGPGRYRDFAAYSLQARGAVGGQILPVIKNAAGLPYLPGSTLKGALRTVVAWGVADSEQQLPRLDDLESNPKYAARRWERGVFGSSPNFDLMRALVVQDSAAVGAEQLELATVSIYSLQGSKLVSKGEGYRFSVEALKPGTRLACRINLDRHLLSHPRLGFSSKADLLEGLAARGRERARRLIDQERDFFKSCQIRPLQQFYDRLADRAAGLGENSFLLQVAWGTGWAAKTLGDRLAEAGYLQELRTRYGLGRAAAPFPKSRRLVERGGAAVEPMGWLEVTL